MRTRGKVRPLNTEVLFMELPSNIDFSYLQLFEGLKAFRGVDNKIRLFRPKLNMDRMYRSAMRATLPVCTLSFLCVSFDVVGQ